ncbi:MAG TPA: Rne/Rng family ribonuclease [Candidatus Sumerlaeota bacterium]|nr:Rne/Rng family ribonuclease [Candidatus Sumerlaeota bacterium]
MRRQVLINVEATDIRVAMLEDGTLVELFVEDLHTRSKIGNIYKGRVESIVPGLRAVFVNIGCEKNAFLHFNDVLPEFELPQKGRPERERRSQLRGTEAVDAMADQEEDDDYVDPVVVGETEEAVKNRPRRPLRVGDEILVQVTKEEINNKGPRITTFISLPGRYLVYMPFAERSGGVSRRIEDGDERKRLRDILRDLKPETGSLIIRTAGIDQAEEAIRQDAEQLQKKWQEITRRARRDRSPARVYDDQEIITRVVRDNFTEDIDEILIDSKPAMRELIRTCQVMVPCLVDRIALYDSPISIFDTFEVEKQFQKALRRKVPLRSGGEIVIDETEALISIDINSGRYVGHEDQEQTILKINLEACRAIARQLRLRDLGGLIVIDFIDMNERENELAVLREFKRCLRSDRAKYAISDFSEFGLVQMTRKRVRKSLAKAIYRPCPYCDGSGRILTDQQLWKQLKYDLMAELEADPPAAAVRIVVHSEFKTYLQTAMTAELRALAHKYHVALQIVSAEDYHHERITILKQAKSTHNVGPNNGSGGNGLTQRGAEKKLETAQMARDNAS